jgi:hypothetical protein
MHMDGAAGLVALGEIVALEHPRHSVLGRQADDVHQVERVEPLRVIDHLGLVRVEQGKHLIEIGLGVVLHLLGGEPGAGFAFSGRVADHSREIADDEDDLMAQLLKLLQLADGHRVTHVQVGRRGVGAVLDAQGHAGVERALDAPRQFVFGQNIHRPGTDDLHLTQGFRARNGPGRLAALGLCRLVHYGLFSHFFTIPSWVNT